MSPYLRTPKESRRIGQRMVESAGKKRIPAGCTSRAVVNGGGN